MIWTRRGSAVTAREMATIGASQSPWTIVSLALVVVLLLASVIIPARQSFVIMRLLREGAETVEPARLLEVQLELALTREAAALEGYRFSGDAAMLERHRVAVVQTQSRLSALADVAARLDTGAMAHVRAVQERIGEWRRTTRALSDGLVTLSNIGPALDVQHASYDAALRFVGDLASYLSRESVARQERIRAAERLSLVANSSLILVALAALGTVARLGIRERRFGAVLRERIAEEVRLREEARVRREELERVVASRSRLMRGFSHDVKNPLSAADGLTTMLADGIYDELTPRQQASVSRIRKCLHSAFSIIDALHELARSETGHITLRVAQVDLTELATALVEEYRASAETRSLSITLEPCEQLVVETDCLRARQVVGNLLSNAIKYTRTGGVSLAVRVEASDSDSNGRWACIDVTDTGPGIPESMRESIFDEFVRLDGSGETSGAGLGLAISKRMAEALGGRIALVSEEGRGSTFSLYLPMNGAEVKATLD